MQVEFFYVIKSLKEMGVSLSKIKDYLKTRSPKNCLDLLQEHEKNLEQEIKRMSNTLMLIKEKRNIIEEYYDNLSDNIRINYEEEIFYVTKSSKDDYYFSKTQETNTSTMVKSAGRYLNFYHSNGYFTIDDGYKQLLDYARRNNIALGEYFYEYMILDELAVVGIDNYVIKISIEII